MWGFLSIPLRGNCKVARKLHRLFSGTPVSVDTDTAKSEKEGLFRSICHFGFGCPLSNTNSNRSSQQLLLLLALEAEVAVAAAEVAAWAPAIQLLLSPSQTANGHHVSD